MVVIVAKEKIIITDYGTVVQYNHITQIWKKE